MNFQTNTHSFLARLADKIAANKEIPLEQTLIVVPNKRASRELLKALASFFDTPVFAPNILSINEFIENLSVLQKIDDDELLIRLYDIYKKKNADKSDDFSEFLKWAPLFLHDINEIDKHLADAKTIFSNLSEIKILETSFGKENLTEMQRKYLEFYMQLADLYEEFNSSLHADNVGYEGMIYKDVSDFFYRNEQQKGAKYPLQNLKGCTPKADGVVLLGVLCGEINRYIFAGFNALTPVELEILQFFYIQKKAEIYFDTDTFYDEKYGSFIEEIRQKLRIPEIEKSNDYKNIPKHITCTGAPKRTAQIYHAIEILNEMEQKNGNLNDTVLVLADESLILPFVHFYNAENVNITMGYPLRATREAQQLQQYIDEEKQNNRLQKPKYDLKKQGFEFLNFLKSQMKSEENENSENDNTLNPYSIIVPLIDEVTVFLQKFFNKDKELDFAVVDYFLQQKIKTITIPFSGNKYEGLQIMGLLETRMLDFKNVIVLSMNERILPKGKVSPSLILYDLKQHFGLPTHQRNDFIFGYHFFRLLQRAENVFLIYDNESTDAVAEKSRFVEQLEYEVKKQQLQNFIHITHNQFVVPFSLDNFETKITIIKNETILEKLYQTNFSPSSLNTYINCPLQFYFRYVEKIAPPQTFDETNESAIIGSVIHGVLEDLFKLLQEKPSQSSVILNDFENNLNEWVESRFKKQPEIAEMDFYQGKLFLVYQIVKKSILDYIKVIKNEWINSTYQIIGTEIPLVMQLNVGERIVSIYGKADRAEVRDNKVTILDYKTGKVEPNKLKCKIVEFEIIFNDPKYSQLFQLLCYAYLYQQGNTQNLVQTTEIQCGIIAFQELYKQNEEYIYYAEIEKDKILTQKLMLLFEEHLKQLLLSIFDEKTAFSQTDDIDNCQYCDYKNICNR